MRCERPRSHCESFAAIRKSPERGIELRRVLGQRLVPKSRALAACWDRRAQSATCGELRGNLAGAQRMDTRMLIEAGLCTRGLM
jgi:hypothetical protein